MILSQGGLSIIGESAMSFILGNNIVMSGEGGVFVTFSSVYLVEKKIMPTFVR